MGDLATLYPAILHLWRSCGEGDGGGDEGGLWAVEIRMKNGELRMEELGNALDWQNLF